MKDDVLMLEHQILIYQQWRVKVLLQRREGSQKSNWKITKNQ